MAQWEEVAKRKANLVNWLDMAEGKVNESVQLIENRDSEAGEGVWERELQEMRVGWLFGSTVIFGLDS